MHCFATLQRCALAALSCCSACDADDSVDSTGASHFDDAADPPTGDEAPTGDDTASRPSGSAAKDSGPGPNLPSMAVEDASTSNTDAGPTSVDPDAALDSADAGVQVVAPLPCVDYSDCPPSLDQTCYEYEGVSSGESALLACDQGWCRYQPIQQSCSDGAYCDGCRGLGRAQRCRQESGSACAVCCYGILAALHEQDIDPDLECACAPGNPCADSCGPSNVCGGQLEPSLDCLGCLQAAFAADGTCAAAPIEGVGAEVCRRDRLDEELSCSQLGLCLANCPP
jgi:hypothetical protein